MHSWQLWTAGEVLKEVKNIEPLVASWEKSTHPAQIRLRAYLEQLMLELKPLPSVQGSLFLHMDIDVRQPARLLRHYDLENYLTPLFGRQWLDASRFSFVSARKQVGAGSRLLLGLARPLTTQMDGFEHFSYSAGSGTQIKRWKADLRRALASSQPRPLPSGPIEVHLAWRCSPRRNWVTLWKPTGDAMGPVLGEAIPEKPFSPNDDRIVSLGLHLNLDGMAGHSVDVGMWWRPAA